MSYIDHEELKMKLGEIKIVPLTSEGHSIKYAGFINYYPYKDKSDLVNLDALNTSEAIVKFTIEGEKLERKITEVEAWNGFTATE